MFGLVRRVFSGAVLFALFVWCYWLPLLLDDSALAVGGGHIRQLLGEVLASAVVQQELLRNGLALLGLLLVPYVVCCWAGRRLARRFGSSVFIAQLVLLLLAWLGLMAGNAWLFPGSNYSVAFQLVASPGWALVCFALLLAALLLAVLSLRRGERMRLSGLLLLAVAGFAWFYVLPGESGRHAGTRNIVLIGVDSLSAEALESTPQLMPNLAGLMDGAQRYSRAYTPMGRTFPAWVSILSGKSPAEHGAVFNLRNMEHVRRQELLTYRLRDMGYHTVFAIDERRFANIDESFGFDRVVGPKAGALDFVLQGVNDNPLSNLLLQTPLGAYLFPYSYINVAAHANYSASGFVDRVLQASVADRPLFMAVHFESAHFPFKTRHGQITVAHENRFMSSYLQALTVADRQVGRLIEGLKVRGVLDDALVILLSDHGEALGEVEASIVRDDVRLDVSSFGHGADLLSDRQNRIPLGVLRFSNGLPVEAPGVSDGQVSLLDLRPVVEAFARGSDAALGSEQGCLIVETGLRLDATQDYRTLQEADVARQAVSFYEADTQGRLRLREDRLPGLLAAKDIGWRCAEQLTWYDSARQRYWSYRLDARGLPTDQLPPDADGIARIEAYRALYLLSEGE